MLDHRVGLGVQVRLERVTKPILVKPANLLPLKKDPYLLGPTITIAKPSQPLPLFCKGERVVYCPPESAMGEDKLKLRSSPPHDHRDDWTGKKAVAAETTPKGNSTVPIDDGSGSTITVPVIQPPPTHHHIPPPPAPTTFSPDAHCTNNLISSKHRL